MKNVIKVKKKFKSAETFYNVARSVAQGPFLYFQKLELIAVLAVCITFLKAKLFYN